MRFLIFSVLSLFLLSCTQADLVAKPSLLMPDSDAETYYWRLECTQQDNNTSYKEVFSMSGQNFTNERWYFNDLSCTTLNIITEEYGTYDILTTGQTRKINLTYTRATAATQSDSYSQFMKGQCGIDEWKTEVIYEIAEDGCGMHLPGAALYDIFNVADQNMDVRKKGDLYFGDKLHGYNGNSPGNRPVSLDKTLLYRHYR